MAKLQPMPPIAMPADRLVEIGSLWDAAKAELPKVQGTTLGSLVDLTVGNALAVMLGGIPVVRPRGGSLMPEQADCVEVGPARVIGGIRPQNFDVAYRPDGVRFAYDSKTLNSKKSFGKNYQNMLNDLGTEATTVHSRFPSAVVAFIFALPTPCLGNHGNNLITALTRLSGRKSVNGDLHKAEALALLVWDPTTGLPDTTWPPADSPLRIERFSEQVELAYIDRFGGQEPHNDN